MMQRPTHAATRPDAVLATVRLCLGLSLALAPAAGCDGGKAQTPKPEAMQPAPAPAPAPTPTPAPAAAPTPAPAPAPAPAAEPAPAPAATPKEAPKDNVKISKEYWETTGKLKFTYEMRKSANGKWARNGLGRAYYDTGAIEREGPYKNNIRVGKWTYYNADGTVQRVEERGTDGKGGNDGDPPLP